MKKITQAIRIDDPHRFEELFRDTRGQFREERVIADFEMRRRSFKNWTVESGHMLLAEALYMMSLPLSKESLVYGWTDRDQNEEEMMTWERMADGFYEVRFLGLENLKEKFPNDYSEPGNSNWAKIGAKEGFCKLLHERAKEDNYKEL